jgi:hypothetical protein
MRFNAILFMGALVSAPPVSADVVTFGFTGTVTGSAVYDLNGNFVFGGGIVPDLAALFAVGDPVSGFYSFESLTPDNDPGPFTGGYFGVTNFDVTIGANTWTLDRFGTARILVGDFPAADFYQLEVDIDGPVAPQVGPPQDLRFTLRDPTATALGSPALPTIPPDVDGFTSRALQMVFLRPQLALYVLDGELTSLTLGQAVPEPTSTALVGTALLLLSLARRRGTSLDSYRGKIRA